MEYLSDALFMGDISEQTARNAFNWVSQSPERRGEETRKEYAKHLMADYAEFYKHGQIAGTSDMVDDEFVTYRAGYAKRWNAYLHSLSRCASSFITGPANFPVRQQQKRHSVADARMNEISNYRERAKKAIIRNLRPDLRPIMSGDSDAVERLKEELAERETRQDQYKAINAAYKAFLKNPNSLDTADLPDSAKVLIRGYINESGNPYPVAGFTLTNNRANIRRITARIADLERVKAMPTVTTEANESGITLEDAPAENRIRVFFPGKPADAIRSTLKSGGFRWAPSIGCWQAYRNYRTIELAKTLVA